MKTLKIGHWKIRCFRDNLFWKLFDLKNDDSETKDLAAVRPEKLAELLKEFAAWRADF